MLQPVDERRWSPRGGLSASTSTFGVRTRAKYARHPIRRPYPFAATNPIRVYVDANPIRSRADAEHFIEWMDRTLERAMAMEDAWNNEEEKADIRALYAEAKSRMIARRDEAEP